MARCKAILHLCYSAIQAAHLAKRYDFLGAPPPAARHQPRHQLKVPRPGSRTKNFTGQWD
jgi:hypothetical protein